MQDTTAIHEAYKRGDVGALRSLLGDPPDFPNCRDAAGVDDIVLEYAIYHSPLAFIRTLLELGADPNYEDHAGFPSLMAALSSGRRTDRLEILELLLSFGADVQQRGHNDYTPLHYAANLQDIPAMEQLLAKGADPNARTRIDDGLTPLEEAEMLGRDQAAAFLKNIADKPA